VDAAESGAGGTTGCGGVADKAEAGESAPPPPQAVSMATAKLKQPTFFIAAQRITIGSLPALKQERTVICCHDVLMSPN